MYVIIFVVGNIALMTNKCKVTTFERTGLTPPFHVHVMCDSNNFIMKMEQYVLCRIASVKKGLLLCYAKQIKVQS